MVAFSGSRVLILLLGLLLFWVLGTHSHNARAIYNCSKWGQKFFRPGHLLLILLVLEISRWLVLGWDHSPQPRWRGL
jgi:hypothetical protein